MAVFEQNSVGFLKNSKIEQMVAQAATNVCTGSSPVLTTKIQPWLAYGKGQLGGVLAPPRLNCR
jgi:hypothetical protein